MDKLKCLCQGEKGLWPQSMQSPVCVLFLKPLQLIFFEGLVDVDQVSLGDPAKAEPEHEDDSNGERDKA